MNVLKNKNATLKNLHLLTSVIFIIPIALAYGLYPNVTLQMLFDINVETVNLTSIFRAMMGSYLAFSAIWVTGIINPTFWTIATWTNIAFMGGLAFGRLLSVALDGLPSTYFLVGLIVELLFAFWGLKNLKRFE